MHSTALKFLIVFQCPLFDGVQGDKTAHILTHFIRRKEHALREYLRNFLLARLDWFTSVSSEFLDHMQMSCEEYIDHISTAGNPFDLLGLFLVSHLYQFHIAIMFKSGVWCTAASNRIKDCMFVLIFNGVTSFSETCKVDSSLTYTQSLVDKTNDGHMPSHRSDLKISLLTEDVPVEAVEDDGTDGQPTDIKPKLERKYYIGFGTGGNKLCSQYKAAINLVVKARKSKENLDSKRRTQNIIKQSIQSGNLRPAVIAENARSIRKMRSYL